MMANSLLKEFNTESCAKCIFSIFKFILIINMSMLYKRYASLLTRKSTYILTPVILFYPRIKRLQYHYKNLIGFTSDVDYQDIK